MILYSHNRMLQTIKGDIEAYEIPHSMLVMIYRAKIRLSLYRYQFKNEIQRPRTKIGSIYIKILICDYL